MTRTSGDKATLVSVWVQWTKFWLALAYRFLGDMSRDTISTRTEIVLTGNIFSAQFYKTP